MTHHKKCIVYTLVAAMVLSTFASTAALASEPFIAEVKMFAGNYAPRGYAFCDGQLMSISSYTALFALVGTIYGGDGRTTFGLPDLRGRTAVHPGTGESCIRCTGRRPAGSEPRQRSG